MRSTNFSGFFNVRAYVDIVQADTRDYNYSFGLLFLPEVEGNENLICVYMKPQTIDIWIALRLRLERHEWIRAPYVDGVNVFHMR